MWVYGILGAMGAAILISRAAGIGYQRGGSEGAKAAEDLFGKSQLPLIPRTAIDGSYGEYYTFGR